jgi:hypothetical protein
MVALVVAHVIPATLALLPVPLRSLEAQAMLVAIGLQESRFLERHQRPNGPAVGFWQFERAGVRGVLSHKDSKALIASVLLDLRYKERAFSVLCGAVEHNDILACAFARLLLWTDPDPLPGREAGEVAWNIYLRTWRPGRPHSETWPSLYREAWDRVNLNALTRKEPCKPKTSSAPATASSIGLVASSVG